MKDYNTDKAAPVKSVFQAKIGRWRRGLYTKPIAHYVAVIFIISIGFSMHYANIQSIEAAKMNADQTVANSQNALHQPPPFLTIYSKTAKVEHSFYKSSKALGLSSSQRVFVMDMFSPHINYNRDFRKGDTLTIFFKPGTDNSKKISQGVIVAVDIKVGKRRFLAMSNAVKMPRIFDRDEVIEIPPAHLNKSAKKLWVQQNNKKHLSNVKHHKHKRS